MILAVLTSQETGRRALVVGLEAINVERLLNDMPIRKQLDDKDANGFHTDGLEGWDLVVLGPEDSARFLARARPGTEFL